MIERNLFPQDTILRRSVSDTVFEVSDTLHLNLSSSVELFQEGESLVVRTISDPKSNLELAGIIIGIIAAVVTVIYTFIALKKLLSKNEQLQSQINELVNLNKLFEKRLRMSVKPHLFINGSGTWGNERKLTLHLHNRGELAFYSGYEIISGDKDVTFHEWESDIEIDNGKEIVLAGHSHLKPNSIVFRMKIKYYDKENYQYESIIEWKKGSATLIETIEL